jgi:NAD-dependent DNA ligase
LLFLREVLDVSDAKSIAAGVQRLLVRGCESLLGIASGLIADGELNDREIQFLSTWLAENRELSACWPGEVIYKRVRDVLSDGKVTSEERAHLLLTLEELVGGSFSDDGAVPSGSTRLAIDQTAKVIVPHHSFCFTGKFIYGTRAACERAVLSRGGVVLSVQKSLDYLVVGDLSSREWKYSSHGVKIEAAMRLRSEGCGPAVVSESSWVAAF